MFIDIFQLCKKNNALLLLKSYLSDRSQYVQIDNVKSNPHTVSCGIPEGSVLGPLLFNICINDIINATRKFMANAVSKPVLIIGFV